MNSTNVPSKNENKIRITGSAMYVTGKEMILPREAKKQADVVVEFGEDGSMEILAGDSKVNENGSLEMENGTTITMVNPKAYQILKEIADKRNEMKTKVASKSEVYR